MELISKLKQYFRKSEDARASSAYIICSVLQKTLSLLTLPLFSRLLTKAEYGTNTVYTSTFAVIIIFTTLNLPYGSFAPAMMKFEDDRKGYLSAVNMICVLFTGAFFLLYYPFRGFWNGLVDLPTVLMLLMGFEMLMSTSIQFWMGKARFECRYKAFVVVTLLTAVLGTACSLVAVLVSLDKGVARVFANGVVICVVGAVILSASLVRGKNCFNRKYWKYALTFNIPLIPYYLSQIIFNQSDRLMINKMTGKSDAAMYGVAYTLAFILTFLLNAINNSFVPWMYRKLKERKLRENKRVSVLIAVVIAVLLLGVIAVAPEFILIMAGRKYLEAVWVVPPVALSLLLLFYSQLFINIEFYFEEKSKLVGASILAAVVNIVLNYFGIKKFGFVAAGYTTLISYILFAVCNYLAMKKICDERGIDSAVYNYKALILTFVSTAILGFTIMVLYPFRLVRLGIIVVGLVGLLCYKKAAFAKIKTIWEGMNNK
jgi:O-antigen/teichoic acid export membrane protein